MKISPRNKRKFLKILDSLMMENDLIEKWEEEYTSDDRINFAQMVLETIVTTVTMKGI